MAFPLSWNPLGEALLDYHNGKKKTTLKLHYADGDHVDLPVEIFFREWEEMPDLEKYALAQCKGKILDIGSGSGCHALVLQEGGFNVTALDIAEGAVTVMREKGLLNVFCGDVFSFSPKTKFDTLLLMMNGIGFVKTLDGLDDFFKIARKLLKSGGKMLLDSSDLRNQGIDELKGENYFGETTLQLEYKGVKTEILEWLYIDRETLAERAEKAGWKTEILFEGDESRFLACLKPQKV